MTALFHNITHEKLVSPRATHTLQIAYTPDSDDAFNFYAWEHGRVGIEGQRAQFGREHIIALNRAARLGRYDVVSISSVAYPELAGAYWILAVGNSIGRSYGPVLVSKHYKNVHELRGKRVAVAGIPTTGGALAMMYCPGADYIEMQYDRIADAIVSGEVDAGVMIHEELLFFPEKGLCRVADLGETWCRDTDLPLPVGLNVVKQELGLPLARDIARTCRSSLLWGLEHFDEAFAFASQFGRGCAQEHVAMFSNEDTVRMKSDVRQALRLMFDRIAALGIMPRIRSFEVIDA